MSGGDTPVQDLQALSNRARAAEEMAVALQTEVEQQMMRNEMLGGSHKMSGLQTPPSASSCAR